MEREKKKILIPAIQVQHRWPVNMADCDVTEFKDQSCYRTFDSYLKKINNAWVSPDSVVYHKGLLIKETLASQDHRSYYRMRHLAKKILTGKKIRLDNNKKYLLVTDLWSAGHFHWFVDVLPKLLCIENAVNEFTLLLPDISYIRSIGLESLELLKLRFEDIILMKETELYKIKNLYYISSVTRSGQMHPELMKKLQHKFIGESKPANKRIYISRDKAPFRKVVNETAFIEVLKNNGFDILYGEDLSLAEQVNIFSTCDTLLGIHGAGLTNCIFMQPGKNVIELRRKENAPSNVGYWHLSDSLDHKYYYYNGIPDSEMPLVGKGCDLTIPLIDFEKHILQKTD